MNRSACVAQMIFQPRCICINYTVFLFLFCSYVTLHNLIQLCYILTHRQSTAPRCESAWRFRDVRTCTGPPRPLAPAHSRNNLLRESELFQLVPIRRLWKASRVSYRITWHTTAFRPLCWLLCSLFYIYVNACDRASDFRLPVPSVASNEMIPRLGQDTQLEVHPRQNSLCEILLVFG